MKKTQFWHWYLEQLNEHEAHVHNLQESLYHGQTFYQEVGIVKSPIFGKMLILDGDTQSSQLDEFIYHDSLVYPALIAHPNPEKILILGGGEGATLRNALKINTVKAVTMVDIDKELVELCKKHLKEWSEGAFEDPRTTLDLEDAREWIYKSKEKFDVIISDLTEPLPGSPSYQLFSVQFFKQIQSLLNPNGIFALQASKADLTDIKSHSKIIKTLMQVFKKVNSYAARVPAFDTVWAFGFASDSQGALDLTPQEIDRRISERVTTQLRFYDSQTHLHIFSLPKYVRENIDGMQEIIDDEDFKFIDDDKEINAGLLL